MSGWLCYTKKMLASAIASIAEELEQTAVDLNDAVQSLGMPGEEQTLYSSFDANADSHASCATTQQPLTSSVLPVNVVPGDPVLEDHFSSPETLQPAEQQPPLKESPKDEVICRTTECEESTGVCTAATPVSRSSNGSSRHDLASSVVCFGDRRPGRVIRTSTGDFYDLADVDDTGCDVLMQEGEQSEQIGVNEGLENSNRRHITDSNRRWLGPFSRVMTFAYAQVTNAVFTMMDESSMATDVTTNPDQEMQPSNHTLHIQVTTPSRPSNLPIYTNTTCSQLTLEVLESPGTWEECNSPERRCLVSPVSIRSTYSSDSFEVIDSTLMDSLMDTESSENGQTIMDSKRPHFTIGEMGTSDLSAQEIISSPISSEMTSSSADYVNFNFTNLISGRYFSARSPETSPCSQRVLSDTAMTGGQSRVSEDNGNMESQPCVTDLYTVHVNVHSDDDDGSSSFDVLSEPSEEEYAIN